MGTTVAGSEAARARESNRLLNPASGSSSTRGPEAGRGVRYADGEVSGLPMVITKQEERRAGVPWLSTALVFVTFSAITFAVLAVKGMQPGNGKLSQIMRVIFPSSELGLRVESQGDRLLVSWNRRNTAVASATEGILQIFDGTQHREVRLDGGQVSDGSVLYKALSPDVTFRLEVRSSDESVVTGSMRVLDATAGVHEIAPLEVANAPAASNGVGNAGAPSTPNATKNAAPTNAAPVNPPGLAQPPVLSAKGNTTVNKGADPTLNTKNFADPPLNTKNIERGQVMIYRAPNNERTQTPANGRGNTNNGRDNGRPQEQTARSNGNQSSPSNPSNPSPGGASSTAANESRNNTTPSETASEKNTGEKSTAATGEAASATAQPPKPAGNSNGTRADGQKQPAGAAVNQPPATGSTITGWDPNTDTPSTSAPPPDAKMTSFQPPKPLLQVMPNTRTLTPGLISQVTRIEVAVRVDATGHVTSAQALGDETGPRAALSGAAVSAAKQWTFQPATLRGEKVESEHTIVFEFRPENLQ